MRRKQTWFDSLSLAEQQEFLAEQCRQVHCPCGGDRSRHEIANLESRLEWAIEHSRRTRRSRQYAEEDLLKAMHALAERDKEWDLAKREVERVSWQLQRLIDADSKIVPFPAVFSDAAGG